MSQPCPSCGNENRDGARFCEECGAPFARHCAACGTELRKTAKFCDACGQQVAAPAAPPELRDPRDYTPNHLADMILQSKSALEGERKQVTVLFADIKGSMELAGQVEAEEWHRILDRFFHILADGVHRFEGTVNQYTGDGIMGLFGAPIAHEDHAQRACYTALWLRDELREFGQLLRRERGLDFLTRIGLNSGEVVVGKIGDDLRMDYTAQGQTVGVAARMQQLAEPGRPYLTEATADLVRGYFQLEDLGEFSVKGASSPVRAYGLEGTGELRTRLDVARARGFSRFVGRADEMSALELALNRAKEGNGQVVGVVGEAGVGKSRVCLEFVEGCRARKIRVLEAHCPAHGKAIPLLPVLELFCNSFGITPQDTDQGAREKIAGRLLLLDETFSEVLPLAFDFLGVPDPERPAPQLDPEARQRQLYSFVRRLIRARSEREPAVFLFDDIQWIDPGSDGFLAQFVEATSGTRTLLLVNFRPEYQAEWMGRSDYQQLPLLPLGPEAIDELLRELLGEDSTVVGLRDLIRERTGGNPFFIEEIVQALLESGSLAGTRGACRLAAPVEQLAIPTTVQAVLAARIDRLPEREKHVLQTAAVIGREWAEPVLAEAAELGSADLAESLRALTGAEFLYEQSLYPVAEYAFKHPLTQEVAYGSQLGERRARVHAAVARAIEKLDTEKLDERAALLAHHWEQAGEALEAARWHARAAGWMWGRGDPEAIRSHWLRIRSLLAPLEDSPEKLGLDLMACGRLMQLSFALGAPADEIEALFAEGKVLAGRIPDPLPRAMLHCGYAQYVGLSGGDVTRWASEAREALRLAEAAGDPVYRLVARMALAIALSYAGNSTDSLELIDQCVAERPEDPLAGQEILGVSPWITTVMFRNWPLGLLGRLDELDQGLRQAIELTREYEQLTSLSWGLAVRVCHGEWSGETSTTLASARQSVEIAERTGVPFFLTQALALLGDALRLEQRYPEALEVYRRTLDLMRTKRVALQWKPSVIAAQALIDSALGKHAKAIAQARSALEEAVAGGNRVGESIAGLTLARVLLATNDPDLRNEIEEIVERGRALCEQTGMPVHLPPLLEVRAVLADRRGDSARGPPTAPRGPPPLHRDGRHGARRAAGTGAGTMNCPACGHENREAAKFCDECGERFAKSCASCGSELRSGAKFCDECGTPIGRGEAPSPPDRTPRDYTPKHLADKILQSKSALEGERKQVTVLFADVKGSLELAGQVEAEEWHRILDRFFQILADGVHRFEGTVNQYTGDGIMALFGAPISHEDHAQRACWAALHLREELRRYADELRVERGLNFSVRMGINSGEVVVGKIGDDLRMDYTAQGQTVGLAARMEELAAADRVYLTQHTADLATGYFDLRDLGAARIRGLSEPLHVFELEGVGRLRTRLEVSRARGFTRFVGRDREMASLESALAQAGEGRGQVVGVVGEAGVGKSRLCLEFVESCRAKGIAVYEAHCPAHGKAVSFLPLLELLRAYFGIAERDTAAEARRKIAGTLVLLDEGLRELLPLVFDFVGVPDPEHPVSRMEPEVRQQRLFAFVRQLFEARGSGPPSITLVDDLQWIDPGSDAFLAQVAEVVNGSRTLLLLNFRPEYQAPWMRKSYYQQLPLAPLGTQAMGELLADLMGRDASLSVLAERIAERASGNPFFAEELVQSLAEVGGLEGGRGAYRLTRAVEELELPATVQAVLSARIDRLAEREKRLLQTASVIGKEFAEAVLGRVAELADADLQAALAALTEAEFLYPKALFPEAEYAFRHPLTQEVAYHSQLGEHRRRVHAVVARALEEVHAESPDEHAALVAHHWESAGEALEAARWHRRTAEWAGVRNLEQAVRHWRSCVELTAGLAGSAEADAIRLASCIGILKGATWFLDVTDEEAEAAFLEGRSLAEQASNLTALARLLSSYGGALSARERWVEALSVLDEATEVSDRAGDRGHRAVSRTHFFAFHAAGRLEELRIRSKEGLDLVGGDPDLGSGYVGYSPLVALTVNLGGTLCDQGHLREGFETLDRGLELAQQHDQMLWLGVGHFRSAFHAFTAGDLDRMMRAVRELAAIAEKQSNPALQIGYRSVLGTVHLVREEWEDAARTLEPVWTLSGTGEQLAQAYLGYGKHSRARSVAEQAVTRNRASGALLYEFFALRTLARVLRTIDAARELETIEASLSRAEALVRETGARLQLPSLHEERARLARALQRPSDADREFREAHRLYTEMAATGHAERLAQELGL